MRSMYMLAVAGWGNRLQPLISCMRLARKFDYRLVLVWGVQDWFPCRFHDVFDAPDIEEIDDYGIVGDVESGKDKSKRLIPRNPDNLSVARFTDEDSDCLVSTWQFVAEGNWGRPSSFRNKIAQELQGEAARLIPKPEIARLLDDLPIDRSVIGIHLRKPDVCRQIGDNPPFRWKPDSDVRREIEKAIDQNSRQHFFFCTDCKPTQNRFVKRYGSRLLITAKTERPLLYDWSDRYAWCNHVRATPTSIKEAYADILGLSRCGKIIANHASTFSTYASVAGGVPLEVL